MRLSPPNRSGAKACTGTDLDIKIDYQSARGVGQQAHGRSTNIASAGMQSKTIKPVILNIGCGSKTSTSCINIDWSPYLIIIRIPWMLPWLSAIIGRERVERASAIKGRTIFHNLRKGIPFPNGSVDAVYHSHLMEHIDREIVGAFQREIFRVLRPGGIQRICLPDLETLVNHYRKTLISDDGTVQSSLRHDQSVARILEQSVRRSSAGTAGKSFIRSRLETFLLGDARARGETHQWMWDRVNIRAALAGVGFSDIVVRSWEESAIPDWKNTGLERASDGTEYKPESLYVECRKPLISAFQHGADCSTLQR
jgi:SAM-dependent methyltransferase